ncbi:hypothetical protein BU15DRAFT_66101 [Melanogaster broomeanus]|nr:hypothetical protein BU15DRAFT_66101 [Melanogaster broomeanus]
MLTNIVGFFANMPPIKTIIDETNPFAAYLGQFKQSLMVCLSHGEVTYEDIVAQVKSSSSGRGYFKHLFALGGMNMETISQVEFHHLRPKSTTSVPNGEERYEFLHPSNGCPYFLMETLGGHAHVKITISFDCKVPDGRRTIIRHRKISGSQWREGEGKFGLMQIQRTMVNTHVMPLCTKVETGNGHSCTEAMSR